MKEKRNEERGMANDEMTNAGMEKKGKITKKGKKKEKGCGNEKEN